MVLKIWRTILNAKKYSNRQYIYVGKDLHILEKFVPNKESPLYLGIHIATWNWQNDLHSPTCQNAFSIREIFWMQDSSCLYDGNDFVHDFLLIIFNMDFCLQPPRRSLLRNCHITIIFMSQFAVMMKNIFQLLLSFSSFSWMYTFLRSRLSDFVITAHVRPRNLSI